MIKTLQNISFLLIFGAFNLATATPEPLEPRYAPDRKVDIIHIKIDITPDFKARTIAATTTIKLVPIVKPLVELSLNAIELSVSSVTSSAGIEAYSVTDSTITVTFEPPIQPGKETILTIKYKAEPKRGLYFRTPEMGYIEQDTHLWTQGEMHEAPYWFPCFDYPNERSSSEVICHVPDGMTVLSNGRLVSEELDPETGLKVVRWLQEKPHVNYLIALAAGKFEKIESRYKDIPLAFFTPASQIEYAQNSFEGTADMMAFFEDETGIPYPWDKYYQVVVDDFTWGGMENTSLTILNDNTIFTSETENIRSSRNLVAHELVHMWFGDYVTCKDWSHTWLNEGFAVYYTHLYNGFRDGPDEMLYGLYNTARRITAERSVYLPIVHKAYARAREQFDYRSYQKGGWVLHMIRTQLGEDLFRKCVKTYLERHALASVVSEDLRMVLEDVTGRTFDRFFDQWVYHARHPDLKVSYEWSEKEKLAKISVEQTHTVNDSVMLFHFPSKIRFVTGGQSIDHDILINNQKHDFYFPLEKQPDIVRFDPDFGLLADIKFDKPKEMLYAQLENKSDLIGRLRAIKSLEDKDDRETVAKLKEVLSSDSYYGVRIAASRALRKIHNQEAFNALTSSLDQSDARVRLQVVNDIGGFYRPEIVTLSKRVLEKEKNPDILNAAIINLGRRYHNDTRKILIRYLRSKSFRNMLAEGAIEAIRRLDDPGYIAPLMKTLSQDEAQFRSWSFSTGLNTLAHISRNEKDKTKARSFLADYVNHPKRNIKIGAIRALGTLGDPAAIPILETFSGDDPEDRIDRTAKEALKKIRESKEVAPEEIGSLRETVDKLRKNYENLEKDIQDIKKRLEAVGEKPN